MSNTNPPPNSDDQELLRCADCENPLVAGFCTTCEYRPSLQDTFIGKKTCKAAS